MDNKNLILGSIAIIAVVIVALILFVPKGKVSGAVKVDTSNIKVYKHIAKTKDNDGYYTQCKLATDDLLTVKNEFEEAYKLSEENRSTKTNINGDYKVIIDNNYLAFDKKNNNVLYLGTRKQLYTFESKMYDIVIKSCE